MSQSNAMLNTPTPQLLRSLSEERILDAEKLLQECRYQSVVYLSGYAVETAIKARICEHLKWSSYKLDFKALKTHDLSTLLDFTGIQDEVRRKAEWSYIYGTVRWSSEMRYQAPTEFDQSKARQTLESAKSLVRVLCV